MVKGIHKVVEPALNVVEATFKKEKSVSNMEESFTNTPKITNFVPSSYF